MKTSLMKKLSLSFLAAVLGALIITSIISNYMINKSFNKYLVDEHKEKVNNVIKIIEDISDEKTDFSDLKMEEVTRYAVLEELYIEVRDSKDNKLFSTGDAHLQRRAMMENMMQGMMGSGMGHMMMGNFSNLNPGEYVEESHPLVKGDKEAGKIIVGYFGTSYLSGGALTFKNTLNQAFLIAIFITLFLALAVSLFISRQLVYPLVKITKTAHKMREGNLEVRAEVNTNTKEIQELSDSINYLAETLQQQEMLRKRLTSDMAHEIRTPITTLKTHVEALIDGIWEPTRERLEIFYEELERLSKLVDNLRNLSRLEQVNLQLNKSRFNLSEELEKLIDTFRPLFQKSNFAIESQVEPGIIVSMDKDKLMQIMHNLLSNANKYLNENGNVVVSLNREKDKIVLKVSDNGTGIPEKDIPYIFERFYRSDMSRNKATGGTGIGLAITKALVEAHGGKIEVKSKLGSGTTFTLVFLYKHL